MVFTGRKNVKGLSQKSTAIVTDMSSPCKIFTGHTHAEFQTSKPSVSAGSTSPDATKQIRSIQEKKMLCC